MAKKGWNDLIAWYRAIPLHLAVHETVLGYYYIRFPENPKRLNRLIAAFDAEGDWLVDLIQCGLTVPPNWKGILKSWKPHCVSC